MISRAWVFCVMAFAVAIVISIPSVYGQKTTPVQMTAAQCGAMGGAYSNGLCFVPYNITGGLTWSQAASYCQGLGGNLPVIRDANDNNVVYSLGPQNPPGCCGNSAVWIGLSRPVWIPDPAAQTDAVFQWIDGTPRDGYSAWNVIPGVIDPNPSNTGWNPSSPNTTGEPCVEVLGGAIWNDVPCSMQLTPVVCYFTVNTNGKYSILRIIRMGGMIMIGWLCLKSSVHFYFSMLRFEHV